MPRDARSKGSLLGLITQAVGGWLGQGSVSRLASVVNRGRVDSGRTVAEAIVDLLEHPDRRSIGPATFVDRGVIELHTTPAVYVHVESVERFPVGATEDVQLRFVISPSVEPPPAGPASHPDGPWKGGEKIRVGRPHYLFPLYGAASLDANLASLTEFVRLQWDRNSPA